MMRAARPLLATVVVSTLLLSGALPASAQEDGTWYFDAFSVGAAHTAGFTGQGVKIAVIDAQINPDIPTLKNANLEVQDPLCKTAGFEADVPVVSTVVAGENEAVHATNVVSFIIGTGDGYPGQTGVQGVAPDATVLFYSAWVDRGSEKDSPAPYCYREDSSTGSGEFDPLLSDNTSDSIAEAMNAAMDEGVDIISISAGLTPHDALVATVARALREGVVVVAAMPNSQAFTMSYDFPARGNGVVAVQALGADGKIQESVGSIGLAPNLDQDTVVAGPGLAVLTQGGPDGWESQEIGYGTSYATPVVASFMAVLKSKYPTATGNQLIQSLLRNTGGSEHDVQYDTTETFGYGTASITGMLAVDPTGYPDENPIIDLNDIDPTYDEIFNPVEPTPEPEPSEASADQPSDSDVTGVLTGLAIAGLIGLVAVAGIVVLIVVLVRRSGKKSAAIDPTATPSNSENS
ncbi:S8 family peptidase [Salinibacterium sp. PAMC 21357]|uniref:S8 family peptidase n=1 Tax=Salinibacterium sp. PAMC 21357 TaxID=1112215 RepID=UPI0002883C4F|nr:S8 family serine peptidase [Salinibacterium sp. PAMC 21357]